MKDGCVCGGSKGWVGLGEVGVKDGCVERDGVVEGECKGEGESRNKKVGVEDSGT